MLGIIYIIEEFVIEFIKYRILNECVYFILEDSRKIKFLREKI